MGADQESRFYIAYIPEAPEVGVAMKRTPQHLTLVPPIVADGALMIEAAKAAGENYEPFPIKISGEAFLGPNNDIEVYEVEPVVVIRALHKFLIKNLEEKAVVFENADWLMNNFHPHITKKKYLPNLEIGQELLVDNISVIRKDGDIKTVVDIERL